LFLRARLDRANQLEMLGKLSLCAQRPSGLLREYFKADAACPNVLRYVNTCSVFQQAACANLLENDKVKSRGLRNLAMERSG